ncbi:MAG: hypothetical protein LIQ30_01260 [Planctomycetes bacterium]|nr:hypothetical protein [Planctomycetota bacterium]
MADEKIVTGNDRVNMENLYRSETFTDLGVGSIQVLRPVTPDGADDTARTLIFMGTAQIMTPHGAIPVQAEIKAATLREACNAFPEAINSAVEELIQQAREYERERAGGIVIPRGGKLELP